MTRQEAIKKMLGADENTPPLKINDEMIFPWYINMDAADFSDEQIEEFYDTEIENEYRSSK